MPDVTFDEVSLYRICFTVEGTVRKNARTRFTARGGKVRAHNSKEHDALVRAVCRKWARVSITSGQWHATIDSYWPRRRHLGTSHELPLCDVDAPISSILDALAPSESVRRRLLVHGIFDDDARIISIAARKFIDKARPRVEVTLKWVRS